jgi:hypothetical protein
MSITMSQKHLGDEGFLRKQETISSPLQPFECGMEQWFCSQRQKEKNGSGFEIV